MITCTICKYETEIDDVALGGPSGRCVCLRCFTRETDSTRPMPKALRRELIGVLGTIEVA
jgi:hypothetical protein